MASVFAVQRDGTRIAELASASVVSVGWRLNATGETTFRVDPTDPSLAGFRLGGGVEIQVWDDRLEVPWWGLPVGSWDLLPTGLMTVDCRTLEAHLDTRRVVTDITYAGLDQLVVGQRLVEHAQAVPPQSGDADLGIAIANFAPSGRLRQGTYEASDRSEIGELLRNLTGVIDGFDWSIEVYPDGRREWTPWYPRRGSWRDVLEWDHEAPDGARGIVTWRGYLDGRTANEVHVTGDDNDGVRRIGVARDTAARARDGLRQIVESAGDGTKEYSTLVGQAEQLLGERKDPRCDLILVVTSTEACPASSIRPGDRFDARIRRGWIAFDGEWRVHDVRWHPRTDTARLELSRA